MKALEIIGKRLLFGVIAAWGVLTAVFLLFTATPDWIAQRIEGNVRAGMGGPEGGDPEAAEAAVERALEQYFAERGLDGPLQEVYLQWMWNTVTLDWGYSFELNEPVLSLVVDATVRTAMYVLPAVVLAVAIGMIAGLFVALRPESTLANGGRVASYLLFAVPSFWLGGLYIGTLQGGVFEYNAVLSEHVLPIVLVTMTLLGGYVSYARAHALEHVSAEFVTLVRAKGAGPVLVTKHVVRNAAIPLFSMLFTEVLGLLVLSIFVIEMVFGIEGFGYIFFFAVDARDIPVLLGCTVVIIAVGVVGNIVQDISYTYLDPRVDA